MDGEFGSWYRAISLNTDHAELSKRWGGIVRAVKGAKVEDALELARAFSGVPTDEQWLKRFREFFKEEDGTFEGANDSEIMVLAGGCLCQLAVNGSRVAELGAQGVQTATFNGIPDAGRLNGIRRRLSDFLHRNGAEARVAQPKPAPRDRAKRFENALPATTAGLPQAIEGIKTLFSDLYAEIDDLRQRVVIAEKSRAESSDVLWWLLSAFSHTAERPFVDVPVFAAPIMLAFDLANLTEMPIGFPNAAAFLREALSYKRSDAPPDTTALKSINAIDRTARKQLVTGFDAKRLKGLAPVLYGLSRSLEVPDDELWDKVAATPEFDSLRRSCTSVALSDQMYNELVLVNAARPT